MAGYSFPTGVEDGFQVELENGVTYEFKAEFRRWDVVKGTGNSVWITDELPDEQYTSNGDLWFDNTEDTMQLFLWHEESDAWLPVAPPTTLEDRVTEGEEAQRIIIQQVQAGLAEQVKLQNKVNALEGVLGEHSFIFTTSNRNPRPGEFNLQDGGMNITNSIDSADYIALSNVDANGKDVNLDRIVENDVIRVGSMEGGSAELRVTSSTGGLCAFEQVSGDLSRLAEVPHDFVLLSSFDPAGLATIEYVDAQDEILSTMITQNGRALNDRVSKSGSQILEAGEWRIKQPRSGGGTASFVVINDNVMHLYHVAYPENGEHAANMQYVDDQIAAIPEPNLSGYATEQYVDDQIAAIPEPVAFERPVLWKYNPDVMADQLGNGEFNLSADPENGSDSDWSIYFAKRDANGHYWYPHDSGNEWTHEIDAQLATIRGRDQNCVHGKTNKWYFNQGTNNYARLKLAYYRSSNPLAGGKWYALHIPGYMPYFTFSADAQNNGTHV